MDLGSSANYRKDIIMKVKDSPEIEIIHNEWCRENGYPIRKRASRRVGGPTSSKQASELNADNSARFVEGARSQALKRSTER